MIEAGVPSPERDTTPDVLAALHNTIQTAFADPTNPEESLQVQREQFKTVIAVAHEQPFDERAQALIDHYATVVDYMWFGGHGDTLPAALGYFWTGNRNDSWGEIGLKEDIIDTHIFDAITHILMPLGLGNLLLERVAYADRNQEEVRTAYKNLVDSTPAAKWFEAFNVGAPLAVMPLSPIERVSREAAIRATATRRFGPAPYTLGRAHPAADRFIYRQSLQLDEETSVRPLPHGQDDFALKALLRYTDSSVAKRRTKNVPVARQEYDSEDGTLSDYNAADQLIVTHDITEVAYLTAEESDLPLGTTQAIDTISREFYIEVFSRAYEGMPNHRAVYEAALADSRKTFLDPIIGGFNLVSGGTVGHALSHVKRVSANQPFDQEVSVSAANQISPYDRRERFSHVTKEDYERERRTLIGTIEKYNNPVPGVMRLLQEGWTRLNLPLAPSNADEADLILRLRNFEGVPHVPGYRLIAADYLQHRYHFSYTPDADPYRPNNTPIPREARERLADSYGQIGLSALGRDVRRARNLTISRLADLSQRHSVYTVRAANRPDFGAMLTGLLLFSSFVQRNKLRGTCDVYSAFGKFSLDEVLPPGRTYVTGGYVITNESNTISAVTHSQVAETEETGNNIVSIMDWTAAAEGNPPRSFLETSKSKGVDTLFNVTPAAPSRKRSPRPPMNVSDQVKASTRQLLMQLGIIFAPGVAEAIPEDYIFGKVKALGARHPITKTLGALLRAGDALQAADELPPEHMSDVLGALAVIADVRRRDRAGVTHPQLDMLEATLAPIVSYT